MRKTDKGLKILLNYFWESGGWRDKPAISENDFAIAKSEGYMFDNSIRNISHDETLERLSLALKAITPDDVANAFLYSLSTRKLEYRSALGSFWYAVSIPKHVQKFGALGCSSCTVCSWYKHMDMNVENFKRYKFGGFSHEDVNFALFDLEQFLKLPKVEPTRADKDVLIKILNCTELLEDNDKVGKLRDKIIKARIYKTNKIETTILLGILGICGVLSSAEFPCYYDKFADGYERGAKEYKNDFYYPVNRWRKKDGVNRECFKRVFRWEFW